ncbi:MAG: hypothetical protein MUC81_07170 [Bacteroidia bacterium]|nr:hypothetical protein [Bacteroidia bacterium]
MEKESNLTSLLFLLENELECKTDGNSPQELYQLWGVCLYYLYRYYSTNNKKYVDKCIQVYTDAISSIIINKEVSVSLHDGLGGFYFLYLKLSGNMLIEKDDRLETYFSGKLKTSNSNLKLDLIGGVFGNYIITKDKLYLNIAYKLLMQFSTELNLLIESFQKNEGQKELSYKERYFLNTGLAHGWAGKLQFIIRYYNQIKNEFVRNKLIDISNNLYKHIINIRQDNHKLQFPSFALYNQFNVKRLSWCHNDLGIAFSLLIYSRQTNNKNVEAIAIDIVDRTCDLNINDNIGIDDPFICHGTAGVALIYYQIYQITKVTRYYDKSQYWLNISYDLYKKYESSASDIGLLQGLSGLGIAVQYLEGEITCTDWLELIQLKI